MHCLQVVSGLLFSKLHRMYTRLGLDLVYSWNDMDMTWTFYITTLIRFELVLIYDLSTTLVVKRFYD